jgi:hypothetical protein
MTSRLAANDFTPRVNRCLLLQDVEFGAEVADKLPKQVPFLANSESESPGLDPGGGTWIRSLKTS